MTEYIITIEDWFFKHVHERYTHFFGCPIEEIVRCRDCYFADEIEGGYWCDRFECGKEPVTSGGFCAWACRKEVDA